MKSLRPFMYDSLGNASVEVAYTLSGSGDTYTLTVIASADWINSEGRCFPVTIDPSYVVSTTSVDDTYIDSDSPSTAHGSNSMLWARANRITYIKTPTPSLPDYAELQWASLTVFYYYFDYVSAGFAEITAHRVNGGSWNENTLTWNDMVNVPNYGLSTSALSTKRTYGNVGATSSAPKQIDFSITSAVRGWINGSYANNGIGLKYGSVSTNRSMVFKSSESNYNYRPRITYQYYDPEVTIRLYGVSNAGHDHLSTLQEISQSLYNNGYGQTTVRSGAFHPSTFKEELKTADIVTIRSHGCTVRNESGEIIGTYVQLNDDINAPYFFCSESMSIPDAPNRIISYISDQDSFDNLDLILFVGCETARSGTNGTDLPSRIVERGARTAVGFTGEIDCETANNWVGVFYQQLLDGETVEQAVDTASRSAGGGSGLGSAIVYGDRTLRLRSQT